MPTLGSWLLRPTTGSGVQNRGLRSPGKPEFLKAKGWRCMVLRLRPGVGVRGWGPSLQGSQLMALGKVIHGDCDSMLALCLQLSE